MEHVVDQGVYRDLSRVYGSSVGRLLELLKKPCRRHYLRVNTFLTTRGELLDVLKEKYPEYEFKPDPFVDEAIYVVVKGPFKVPVVGKKIVVDWRAVESIMLGANVYAPGVIGYEEFGVGEEVNIVSPRGDVIAYGVTKVSSDKIRCMKKGVVVETITSIYKLPPIADMEEYKKGLFYPQSLPAMLVSKIIDPKPGETILDCCAAPGGKTSHIAQLSRGLARIVAVDRSMPKINKLVETFKRLRIPRNLHVVLGDSRYLHIDMPLLKPSKILVDPPCTGLGYRPKALIDKTYRDLVNSANYQKQFINMASRILEKNGLLVYSTCTLTFSENEGVSLYARKLGFKSIEIELPYASKVYVDDIVGYRFDPFTSDMNGFFIAVFRKTS